MLHQQASCNGFQCVINGLRHSLLSGIRFGNEVGETGPSLAGRIPRGATNDLHDFGQAGAIAHCQCMFTPNPVKSFLGHAQGNDDVHMVTVVLLCRIFQRAGNPVTLALVIVHQVGNLQQPAIGCFNKLEAGNWVRTMPFTQLLYDVLYLPNLVLGALTGVDVGNVDNGFLARVEHF